MIELVLTSLIPTLTVILTVFYLYRKLPDVVGALMQNALNDVGQQLQQTFAEPTVKRAMSILGKQSGEVRADNALKEKVADTVMEQSPIIKKVLETLGISPLEGLQLMQDPTFAPLIQGFLSKGLSAYSGMGKTNNDDYGDPNLRRR